MSKIMVFRSVRHCIFLAAALLVLTAASFPLTAPTKISIADAKKLSLGTEIVIEGTVTVASGTFRSSFDDYGFQVQDKTSGMYVSVKTDPHLAVGQKVRLTGKLTETPLKFQIVETGESRIQKLEGTSNLKPVSIATGKIDQAMIGKLIKVNATVASAAVEVAPYGFRLPVNDGSGEIVAYVSTSTRITSKDLVPGQKLEITGVAGQFNDHFQIYPRSPDDVKLIGVKH